ncbi:MAG: hypothetical protein AB4050_08110 [Synechococcus sp.]
MHEDKPLATFQLETQDFLEMQRALNQSRMASLLSPRAGRGRQETQRLRQELYKTCTEMEILLEECERLTAENRYLKSLVEQRHHFP